MGQKVNPHGLRVGIIRNWDSRWFVRDDQFGDLVVEDDKIRKFVKKKIVHCARPGAVIGKGGTEIEKLRQSIEKLIKKPVALTIVEEKRQDLNAQLVAERIALDLEKRISFRRATRSAIDRAMKAGAKGIKTNVAGRLGGAEIARSEHYHEGTIPLQTLRADIDYGFAEAATTYGRIGVKVWIYKGEILNAGKKLEVREERRHVNAKKSKI